MTSGCPYSYHSVFKRFNIMATWKVERRWENNTVMSLSERGCTDERRMEINGLGLCQVAGFGFSSVETSGFTARFIPVFVKRLN